MDYLTKFKRQVAVRSFIGTLIPLLVTGLLWIALRQVLELSVLISATITGVTSLVLVLISTFVLVNMSTEPVEMMERVIGYAAHSKRDALQPDLENMKLGRELIVAQSHQIYDLASRSLAEATAQGTTTVASTQSAIFSGDAILNSVATPLFGVDATQTVTMVNSSGAAYVGKQPADIVGKPIFDILNLSFQGEESYADWLTNIKSTSVTASRSWNRVRHVIDADNSKQFDMVASFSSGNQSGTESMIALFDKTEGYHKDDQELSFVALAVHELRTPLTIMRGYIEVFEDELGPTLSPELTEFMHKMHASAQQLAAFVSNILNVARVEEDQLALKLRSESWPDILKAAVEDLELRARVHGKHIELHVADNLPPIATDRISIHEVINNLVDNAIKYSGKSEKIVINSAVNANGLIETSVQDFGLGIPESVLPQLFQKFHRSHKSSVQVGGTGLGLFLCKALINAHGGNIWVRSKEGEGSIFTFTLLPYDQVSSEQVEGEDGIIRGAHGWIKNHSLYRN
jgi:signal transduction histidine kinase